MLRRFAVLLSLLLVPAVAGAQDAEPEGPMFAQAAPDPLLDSYMGTWTGGGQAMGATVEEQYVWTWAIMGTTAHVVNTGHMVMPDGSQLSFETWILLRAGEDGTYTGAFFGDSSGVMALEGRNDAGELELLGNGPSGRMQMRTERTGPNAVTLHFSIEQNGQWVETGTIHLTRS